MKESFKNPAASEKLQNLRYSSYIHTDSNKIIEIHTEILA